MSSPINWFSLAYFSGSITSLYLAVIFIGIKDKNKWASVILSLFLFKFAYAFFISFVYYSGLYQEIPFLVMTKEPLRLTFGPLIYFYVLTLTAPGFRFAYKNLFHFLPFLFSIAMLIPLYLYYGSNMAAFIKGYKDFKFTSVYIFFAVKMCQDILYVFFVTGKLRLYRQRIKNEFSYIERINLSWISNFLYAYILIVVLYIFMSLFFWIVQPEHQHIVIDIVNLFIIIFVFFFGYMGLTRGNSPTGPQFDAGRAKYERSSLSEKQSNEYGNQILHFLVESSCYRDSELTLKKLADNLSLSPHNLSQVINQKLNKNFYELVNYYRIEEAKKILSDPTCHNKTIIEILLDCGFKSKSVFNTLFKEDTGMTPTQYRRLFIKK